MVFTVNNNELLLFGKNIKEIKDTMNELQTPDEFGQIKATNSIEAFFKSIIGVKPELKDIVVLNEDVAKSFITAFNAQDDAQKMEDMVNLISKQDETMSDYLKTVDKGKASFSDYQLYCQRATDANKQMTLSAKAGKVAMQGLAIAGNMLLSLAIPMAISLVVKALDKVIVTSDELREKVEELTSKYKTALDTANKNLKTIEGLVDRYEELSDGVDNLGRNVSLSNEDFAEYNNIVNQIAEMSPELVKGWTEEGNAILSVKGNVDELINSYKEAQKEAYNLLISTGKDADGNDIIKNFQDVYFGRGIGSKFGDKNKVDLLNELISISDVDNYAKKYGEIVDKYKMLDQEATGEVVKQSGFWGLLHKGNKLTQKELNDTRNNARVLVQTYQAEMDNALSHVKSMANAYLMTNEDYEKLDEQSKNIASVLVNTLDENIASERGDDIGVWVSEIIEILNNSDEKTQKAFSDLFSVDFSEMSPDEAKAQIDSLITTIASVLDEDVLELKIRLGFDGYDNLADNYNTIIDNAAKRFAGVTDSDLNTNNINSGSSAKTYQENLKKYQEEKQALDDFARENKINTQEEIAFWNQCINESLSRKDAIDKYLQETVDEIKPPTITETVDAISNELKPALESLKGSYTSIFSEDGFKAGNVDIDDISSVKSALDNLKEEYKLEIDYEEYEDFVKVITDTDAEASDVQEAFNSMASMMVNASSAVKLTEENFDLLQTQLENLGITNAKEVLSDMKNVQEELAAQGIDLYNSSLKQAEGFIAVAEGGSTATHYLQMYWLEKELANNPLNTSADIAALEQTCSALNITGEYWKSLIRLKSLYYAAEHGGLGTELQDEIQQEKANLDALYKDQYKYKVDLEFDGNIGGSGSGGGSGSEYDWKNLLDKEIAVLEKQLDAGLIDFDTYLGKRLDLIEKYYQEGKIKAEDYYDYLEKTYENQLSIYDRVISAVTNKLEKQIEQLEKQKAVIEEGYQLQIDKLNEEIELLEKEYQKKKDLEELEQARYNAEKARNNRTKKLYTGDNFIYTHDDEAVRSSEEELADKELQMNISRLEEQIESLEKEMEEATKQIEDQIEHLREYIEQWSQVSDAYEEAQNEMLASQVLGAQWEAEILALRQDVLEQFKDEYIRIQEEMANAALKAAEAQLEAEKLLAKGGGSGSGSGANKSKDESESKSHKWEYRGKVYDSFEDAEKDAENYAKDYVNKYVGNNAYTQDALEYYINKEKNSIVKCAKGGVIKKSDNIFSPIAESIGEDTMIAVRDGERVLTPIQNKHFEKLISISDKLVPALLKGNLLNNNLFGNLQNNNMPYVPATANSINISIGDINLHEVNDVNTLSQAIISQLPNKISQAINRR